MYSKDEGRYFFHNAFSLFKKSTLMKYPFNENLIAKDIDGYKEIVSTLINDAKALTSLKNKIQQQLSESKLMDTSFFARSFEDTILGIIK